MAKGVQIRKGVFMVPIHDLPLDRVLEVDYDSCEEVYLPNKRIKEWLHMRGLDSDEFSNSWTYYFSLHARTASFYFTNPKLAMEFKLIWT